MVLRVLKSGVRWVQYRDKEGSRRDIFKEASGLRRIAQDFNALLIINDHPDIALAVNADGAHLGQDDLPMKEARKIMGKDKLVGISTHNFEQAIDAERNGADYIGFGPMFRTMTKKDAGTPKGIRMLQKIRSQVHIPIVAIGGITIENVRSVFEAGADAAAVASAILNGDIEENIKRFLEIIRSYDTGYRTWDSGSTTPL
jgi:thiamine-phosphate pyrophosphorylase